MILSSKSPSSSSVLLIGFFLCFTCVLLNHDGTGKVRSQVTRTTDPREVAALNAIFSKWKITSSMSKIAWNTSSTGDPCSGNATLPESENINFRDSYDEFNPAILCSYDENNTYHIIRLQARGLDIVGTIPEELKQLKYLNNLQIARNYLTGSLPPFIGNFTNMLYLSIGENSFSGTLPKEVGNLKKLISFGLGSRNNFSGPLPPEIGNMTNIEQMALNSNGFEGEIPRTIANLKKLKRFWISDNNFVGKVPDFFGNLTNLNSLRMEGNSFQGPIPKSFGNLVQLTDLRLGGISNSSTDIEFIKDIKFLQILTIRDCMVSGAIPEFIGQLLNLTYLDLSFNNFSGQIPPALFNQLEELQTLYLGNNSLSGGLPDKKSSKLTTIDLSYNNLSGSLPQWVDEKELELNLVANYYEIDIKRFPRALKCLQRDTPCSRGSPNYYSFAINCGGNETVTVNSTIYEKDVMESQTVSTASYYMTSTQRWAVSSVGTFMGGKDLNFIKTTSANISNVTYPGQSNIFQSGRSSPSSLRYFGIGLENGNYTVTLQFAEIQFENDLTWKSFGRRVFDIYIQGIRVAKDFEIKKEAGGRSFRAIEKVYTSLVTVNFLEIHFFWAGKGTCCIPSNGDYGPLISAISVSPNFKPTVNNQPPKFGSSDKKTALIAGLTTCLATSFIVLVIIGLILWNKKNPIGHEELSELEVSTHIFSYSDLKKCTSNFSDSNKLGEGGFGPVFKGELSDGKLVAVKKLRVASDHGKKSFIAEISAISSAKHRNLVNLYGCCYKDNNRLIVYEYMENGSLDQTLHAKNDDICLDWTTRFSICLGTARGLCYLHEESRYRIIHRDIKSSNILLDFSFNPKISDFGLAKLYEDKMTHIRTRVAGTLGYLAPEYAMRGHLTEKADVFSFGIVCLEILSGRPSLRSSSNVSQEPIFEWAWKLHQNEDDIGMLDQKLLHDHNKEEVDRLIGVAILCTQINHTLRPSMSRVVSMLVGDIAVEDIPSKSTYISDWHVDDFNEYKGESFSWGS